MILLVVLGVMNLAAMVITALGLAGERLWFPGAAFRLGLGVASFAAILAVVADPGLAAGLGHVAMPM